MSQVVVKQYSPADYHSQLWKNGLGSTLELAKQQANDESFDWRLSIATLAGSGDYSNFQGIDRTQVMLQGERVLLDISGHQKQQYRAELTPFTHCSFSGEDQVSCVLEEGQSALMFNVMCASSYATHRIDVCHSNDLISYLDSLKSSDNTDSLQKRETLLIFVAKGDLSLTIKGDQYTLAAEDLLHVDFSRDSLTDVSLTETLSLSSSDARLSEAQLIVVRIMPYKA